LTLKTGKLSRVIVERFSTGDDILERLNDLARNNQISAGSFTAIGAAQKAILGYYVGEGQHSPISVQGPLEIVSCVGNVSIKDNRPFVHAHITLSDKEGKAYGGHLMPGTTVGATFEVTLSVYDEMKLVRKLDQITKLPLLDT
jgi:predicted DNA-binding protein with PD1-like motif